MFEDGQRQRLFATIAGAMSGVPKEIVQRQLGLFHKVHPDYARGIADELGVTVAQ